MPHCLTCALSFKGNQCPRCGGAPALTPKLVNQALKNYSWPILVGLGVSFFTTLRYPLLDANPILFICLLILFAPLLTHMVVAIRKRLPSSLDLLRIVYKWAGVLLAAIAALLLLNGVLDNSPSEEIHATVVRKFVSQGRHGTTYTLIVSPSWRPGRNDENLKVGHATFSRVQTGQSVAVATHRGALGLPWYSRVVPHKDPFLGGP